MRLEGTFADWIPAGAAFTDSGWCELKDYKTFNSVAFIEPGETIPAVGSIIATYGPRQLPQAKKGPVYEVMGHIWHMQSRSRDEQSTLVAELEAGETSMPQHKLTKWLIILVKATMGDEFKARIQG